MLGNTRFAPLLGQASDALDVKTLLNDFESPEVRLDSGEVTVSVSLEERRRVLTFTDVSKAAVEQVSLESVRA